MGNDPNTVPTRYGRFPCDPFFDTYWTPRLVVILNGKLVREPISANVGSRWVTCYDTDTTGAIIRDPATQRPITQLLTGDVVLVDREQLAGIVTDEPK